MKKTFFKRAFSVIGATVSIISLSVSALAVVSDQNYETDNNNVTYVVSPSENAYVYQRQPNAYDESSYVVMSSEYQRTGNKFSLTGIYGAQPFIVTVGGVKRDPAIRYARVVAIAGDKKEIASDEQTATANDVTVLAKVNNETYTSQLDQATFRGDSRIERYSTATAYCPMDCTLNFE